MSAKLLYFKLLTPFLSCILFIFQLSNYNNTDISKKVNIENEINNLDANNYSMFIGQKYNLQNQLNNINAKIDLQNQIDNLNQSNQTINNQLKTNANTGSITINSANQTNIIANQNQTSNQYTYNASSFSGTTKNQEDLNIAETISPLLSSKDITINSGLSGNINNTNDANNINLLSSILTGQGNLTLNATNGNINMNSLQDQYYYYSKHELTNLDIGALIAEILAAIIIGAFTAGAGAAFVVAAELSTVVVDTALAVALAVSVATNAAVVGAGVAALGVGLGVGMNAAIDNKNNGAGATKDMQTGFSDSTTKSYNGLVGNSLLFGGSVNLVHGSTGSANIDKANNIQSNSLNQTANNNESALFSETHSNITPNWNSLMTEAAIIGVISGATVAGGDAFVAWAGKDSSPAWAQNIAEFDKLVSDSLLKFTIFTHPVYPGVETLTRQGLEAGASGIENLVHNNN